MPEDASLDQFAAPDGSEREADDESAPVDAADRPDDDEGSEVVAEGDENAESETPTAPEASDVAPAVSTYAWSPDGGECAACGETVAARWRAAGQDGGDLVCADCKEW